MKGLLITALSAVVAFTAAMSSAAAEPLPTQRYLPLSVAIEAALPALKECTDKGHHVSVEVCAKAGIDKIRDRLAP
jgi:hypothetical protein